MARRRARLDVEHHIKIKPRAIVDRPWRIAATGFCFATFGAGGLMLSFLAFPLLQVLPRQRRVLTSRWIIHMSFRLFMGMMQTVGVLRFEVRGREHLRQCGSMLVMANHPTLIDVVALISLIPNASCVVKQTLWRNPFLGGVVRAAGYISNSDPNVVVERCAVDLRAGHPLIIFPEGTRSVPGKRLRFRRGAAHIALRSGHPIIPVIIGCRPVMLNKHRPWYDVPPSPGRLRIDVLEPIAAGTLAAPAGEPARGVRELTQALEHFFISQTNRHGHDDIAQT